MYQDMKSHFWWTKMKKEIAAYVAQCDMCCRVKAIHMKPTGLLQPLSVLEWKWEEVSMTSSQVFQLHEEGMTRFG